MRGRIETEKLARTGEPASVGFWSVNIPAGYKEDRQIQLAQTRQEGKARSC